MALCDQSKGEGIKAGLEGNSTRPTEKICLFFPFAVITFFYLFFGDGGGGGDSEGLSAVCRSKRPMTSLYVESR